MRMLNTYYTAIVPEILAEGGTVVQFVGDAVMAIFNAPVRQPDHALRAARAGLALQRAVAGCGSGWMLRIGTTGRCFEWESIRVRPWSAMWERRRCGTSRPSATPPIWRRDWSRWPNRERWWSAR